MDQNTDPATGIELPLGPALERRLERIECAMYLDLYDALPAELATRHGVTCERAGSELRLLAAGVDHPFFNRVMAVGLDRTPDAEWLTERTDVYRRAGVSRFMLQVLPHVETEEVRLLFESGGLAKLRGWAKHAGPVDTSHEAPTDLRIESVDSEAAVAWAKICAEGFALPPALAPWLEAIPGRMNWRTYLAYDGIEPVACAAFFASGGVATLTFATTRPEARRRGAQSALIQRRLQDIAALRCRWVVTETDEEVAERPNPSLHNVVRLGLPVRYVRANWGPPPPA